MTANKFQPELQNNLKFVFSSRQAIIYRLRLYIAGKLIPKRASQFTRAWIAGIPVSIEQATTNRAQRRAKKK